MQFLKTHSRNASMLNTDPKIQVDSEERLQTLVTQAVSERVNFKFSPSNKEFLHLGDVIMRYIR